MFGGLPMALPPSGASAPCVPASRLCPHELSALGTFCPGRTCLPVPGTPGTLPPQGLCIHAVLSKE